MTPTETPTMTASNTVDALVRPVLAHTRDIRHDLHRHPELMFEEVRTSGIVASELKSLGIEHATGLAGGTGVLGYLPATANPDTARTIALRADMDALPILEETEREYASQTPGVMHACGHDGHTAMLLGVARALAAAPSRPNNVVFVFQPAEEGGAGGEKMCDDGALDGSRFGKPVDMIYGLHGWPELPLGMVATRTGPLLASTDEFVLTIRGRGGHAAAPHRTIDPIIVAAHVVTALQTIASRHVDPTDSVVVTVGSIQAGTTFNVIPERAVMQGTIRTLNDNTRAEVEREFRRIAHGVSEALGASAEIEWHSGYPVTVNDAGATDRFRRIAKAAIGPERFVEKPTPTMGGEDFSYYGKHVPASFFMLGLCPPGETSSPALHTPRFDFNDDALETGISLMCRLALDPA